ncbi:MAG: T9SS type A sorting domain-containing protein [Ferruginibacter sp.]
MKVNLQVRLLVFSGMLLSFIPSFATTWYVNDGSLSGDVFTTAIGNDANPGTAASPFASIQFAINSAATGDTLYVDAGTYTETILDINKSLVIRGAKFGIPAGPAAVPVNRGTNESVIIGGVYYGQSIDNISFDGFTVNTGINARGISARGLNSVVINNIVIGIPNPAIQQLGIATRANGPLRLHSYLIRNNNVTGFRFGIYFDGNLENPSEISYNYVANCFTTGFVLTGSNGHLYRGNVSNNNNQGMVISKGSLSILENTFSNNTLYGIRIIGTASTANNNIENNFIQDNGIGIGLTDPDPAAVNNQAHYNSFTGNGTNIDNAHSDNFNATCNWLESADQVLIAATINGPVTYVPFLTDGIDSDPSTDGFQPATTCVVVPVILQSFTGQVKNQAVNLQWQTSTEVNSSHFMVERSIDNNNFEAIGIVRAQGFSNQLVDYRFTDQKPPFDRPVYYRLRMVDLDGSFKHSRIIRLMLTSYGDFVQQVYPNPVKAGDRIQVDFVSATARTLQLALVSATGQIIQTYAQQVFKGNNRLNLVVPLKQEGIYFLTGKTATGQTFRTPIKID